MPSAAFALGHRMDAAVSLWTADWKFDIRLTGVIVDVDVAFDPPSRLHWRAKRLNDPRVLPRHVPRTFVDVARFDCAEDDQRDRHTADDPQDDDREAADDAPLQTAAFLRRSDSGRWLRCDRHAKSLRQRADMLIHAGCQPFHVV